MKKLSLTLAIFSLVSLISCKKHYECSCHTAAGVHEHVEVEAKKSEADAACKAKATGSYTACTLE